MTANILSGAARPVSGNNQGAPFQENIFFLFSFIVLGSNIFHNIFCMIHKRRSRHSLSQIPINIITISLLFRRKFLLKKMNQWMVEINPTNNSTNQKKLQEATEQVNRVRMITMIVLAANTYLNIFYLCFAHALSKSLIATILLCKGKINQPKNQLFNHPDVDADSDWEEEWGQYDAEPVKHIYVNELEHTYVNN